MCQEIIHVHHIKAARVLLLLPLRFAINFAQIERNKKIKRNRKKSIAESSRGKKQKIKCFAIFFRFQRKKKLKWKFAISACSLLVRRFRQSESFNSRKIALRRSNFVLFYEEREVKTRKEVKSLLKCNTTEKEKLKFAKEYRTHVCITSAKIM